LAEWFEQLSLLKKASIDSHRVWVQAGKPCDGPLFHKRQACRICSTVNASGITKIHVLRLPAMTYMTLSYKNGTAFWQWWCSKFDSTNKCIQVKGKMDVYTISDDFADYFGEIYSFSNQRTEQLQHEYTNRLAMFIAVCPNRIRM